MNISSNSTIAEMSSQGWTPPADALDEPTQVNWDVGESFQFIQKVRSSLLQSVRDPSILTRLGVATTFVAIYKKLSSLIELPLAFLEYYNDRSISMFRVIWRGGYLCDAIEPSLHKGYATWATGGRGGLPTGLYWLAPYHWRDKDKDVWELRGDRRRGAILIHAGNTVKDSKGCFLVGVAGAPGTLSSSRLATAALWGLIETDSDPAGQFSPDNGALILRKSTWYDKA